MNSVCLGTCDLTSDPSLLPSYSLPPPPFPPLFSGSQKDEMKFFLNMLKVLVQVCSNMLYNQ